MNLEQLLRLQWGSESMVKHCLKSSKYVQLDDTFVSVCGAKPSIQSTMWYDDETEGPQVNFESFRRYNESNFPRKLELERNQYGNRSKLFIAPHYHGDKTDGKLAGLRYEPEDRPPHGGREVTPEELEIFNQAIEEVQADYEKRLKTYWKRYSDKVHAAGYWTNR